jgi:hypothetical protein
MTVHYKMVMLQKVHIAKLYVLQNSMSYTMVHVKKGYSCEMVRVTKRYMLQDGTCYIIVHHKRVHVTKWYIFYIYYECLKIWIIRPPSCFAHVTLRHVYDQTLNFLSRLIS